MHICWRGYRDQNNQRKDICNDNFTHELITNFCKDTIVVYYFKIVNNFI